MLKLLNTKQATLITLTLSIYLLAGHLACTPEQIGSTWRLKQPKAVAEDGRGGDKTGEEEPTSSSLGTPPVKISAIDASAFSTELIDFAWSEDHIGDPRDYTSWRYRGKRDARSRQRSAASRTSEMRELFKRAGVSWPPAELYLRAFKLEGELELWAASKVGDPLTPVITWKVCTLSGYLGPKRREGDGQVPEGFYQISGYNPMSRYHLSMRVSYPNQADRLLGHPKEPGSDIMIHGNCVSIGCIALTDQRIEELWTITQAWKKAQRRGPPARVRSTAQTSAKTLPLTIYPTRYLNDLLALAERHNQRTHLPLWRALTLAQAQFKASRRPPQVTIDSTGAYHLRPREGDRAESDK